MIRLYGHLRGSFRTVSEGLRLAFSELGVLDGYYIGEQQDFDEEPVGGATSPIAVVVGDPLRALMAHTQGDHKEIWLLLAPNSEGVPPKIVKELVEKRGGRRTIDGLLAPSNWAKKVLDWEFRDHDIPVELCQHGVLPCFQMHRRARDEVQELKECFDVLHLTSTNLSRKGTRELIAAWKVFKNLPKGGSSKLHIAVNPEYFNELSEYVKTIAPDSDIQVVNGQNLEFSALANLYNWMDYVIQPSRAEGFGLVPLEARACGVPAILTYCTGHTDHVEAKDGVILVQTTDVEESDDYWGSKAEVVKQEDIADALLRAYIERDIHQSAAVGDAEEVQKRWTWKRGAQSVVAKWKDKYG